jgi:hypothetical protein
VLDPERMQQEARAAKFVQRQRIADASSIFWALVVTLGGQTTQYLSDVLRTLNCQRGWTLRYKPFWNRLAKPAFARFMRETFQRLCSELVARVLQKKVRSAGAFFSDIFIDDGTSFGLADGLQEVFPSRFTRFKPAGVELHARMSLFRDQVVSVKLAPDKEGEPQFAPRPHQFLRRSLTLRDRGYLNINDFRELKKTDAYLICRAKKCINPVVVRVWGVARSLARGWKGKRLADVPLSKLKHGAEFLVAFTREGETIELRLVLRRVPPNPRRGAKRPMKKPPAPRSTWMYLLTNLPEAQFKTEDIERLYRLRWQIELAFKDWKSYSSLRGLQSENPAIVEGLIWAALCAALLKRALAHWAQLVHARPVSTRISAQSGPHILPMMVDWAIRSALATKLARVFEYLAENAPRAHPNRDKKRPQQALGLVFALS